MRVNVFADSPRLCGRWVSTLVEEFRAPLVEGLTLQIFNNRLLKAPHFITDPETGAPRLLPKARGDVIRAYEQRVARAVISPTTGHRTTWRGVMEDQINAFAAALEGRRETYEPYRMDY